jgi:hypothetical protein
MQDGVQWRHKADEPGGGWLYGIARRKLSHFYRRRWERFLTRDRAIQPQLWVATNHHLVDVWLTALHGR